MKENKPRWDAKNHTTRLTLWEYQVPTMVADGVLTEEEVDRIASFIRSDDIEMRRLGIAMLEAFYDAWKIKSVSDIVYPS